MYDESALLTALETVVKKHANYTDENVSIGDHRILDGGLQTAVVIEAGSITAEEDEANRYFAGTVSTYSAVAYVYRSYTYDAETRKNLRDDVQNVREIIDGYHRLDGNAESSKVVTVSDPVYVGDLEGGGPYFIVRRLTVRIVKIEDLTNLE
jgi:hypothetical protein